MTTGYLHVSGTQILDSNNNVVHLIGSQINGAWTLDGSSPFIQSDFNNFATFKLTLTELNTM
jgi:hypothetical protein